MVSKTTAIDLVGLRLLDLTADAADLRRCHACDLLPSVGSAVSFQRFSEPNALMILTIGQTWLKIADTDQMPDGTAVASFVITMNHELALAPRRSEHVACASGGPVLSAGEITFDEDLTVTEITMLTSQKGPA